MVTMVSVMRRIFASGFGAGFILSFTLDGDEMKVNKRIWIDPRFAASMWIYTEAVVCDGQNRMQNKRIFKLRSIMEGVNLVCDDRCS